MTAQAEVLAALHSPVALTVVYDEACPLCVRCRHWLEAQPTFVPLSFLGAHSAEARAALGPELPWLGEELIVVGDEGEAWVGPAAFLVALWATRDYRGWSYVLSGPRLSPLAERFFHAVSQRRAAIGRRFGPGCEEGTCKHRR